MAKPDYQWGKMSRGQPYIMLATDMFRAFAALGLGEVEGLLLAHVIENTWGRTAKRGRKGEPWPETEACPVEIPALCLLFNVKRQNLYNSLARLVRSRVLLKVEGGYLVNKEAHTWSDPTTGETRLRAHFLSHAASAQKAFVMVQHDKQDEGFVMAQHDKNKPFVMAQHDNEPGGFVMVQHDKPESFVMAQHDKSGGLVMAQHDNAHKERTRGNPTGLIQNPTGLNTNASRHQAGAPEPRSIATTTSSSAPVVHATILRKTGSAAMADHVVREMESRAARGDSADAILAVIRSAIRAGRLATPEAFSDFLRSHLDRPTILPPSPIIPGQRLSPSEKRVEHYRTQYAAMKAHRRRKESENAGQ